MFIWKARSALLHRTLAFSIFLTLALTSPYLAAIFKQTAFLKIPHFSDWPLYALALFFSVIAFFVLKSVESKARLFLFLIFTPPLALIAYSKFYAPFGLAPMMMNLPAGKISKNLETTFLRRTDKPLLIVIGPRDLAAPIAARMKSAPRLVDIDDLTSLKDDEINITKVHC